MLRIIRNALAHGNLHTDGNPTDGNHIHLLRLHSEEHHECYWNKVIGYKYPDIPVSNSDNSSSIGLIYFVYLTSNRRLRKVSNPLCGYFGI